MTGITSAPLTSRGQSIDQRSLPRAFVWIESESVEALTKPDDDEDPASGTDRHIYSIEVGVITQNHTAIDVLDVAVSEIQERMWVPFEGHELDLVGVDYEDEVRTFARPFVAAVLNFTLLRNSPSHDAG